MESKTTNPKSYIELLEVFRIALIHKIIDKQVIISWADIIIRSDTEPDYFVIELSLAGHNNDNEILTLLNTYIVEHKTLLSGRVILGLLYKQLFTQNIELKKAVTVIKWLVEERKLTEKDERLFYRLDEHYELAAANITGNMNAVHEYTFGTLELYSSFTVDNVEKWNEINAKVNRLIDEFDSFLY